MRKILPVLSALVLPVFDPGSCTAQLMSNSNVAITVNNVQLTVKGDIENESGTTISNSGILDLSGNWINNSGNTCFGLSAGTVILNGVSQSIGGADSTVFNNLTILGSGVKSLLRNTVVGGGYINPAGVLSLEAATLDLNSKTLFIVNPDSSAVSYVDGSIRSESIDNSSTITWDMQNITGTHTLPFSNGYGTKIPFSYNLLSGFHGYVSIATYAADAANSPYPSAPNPVASVNSLGNGDPDGMAHRYWQVDAQYPGELSELTFSFDPVNEKPVVNDPLFVQQWDNFSSWNPHSNFQSMPTGNTVKVTSNIQYGTFGMAIGAGPLPITLLSFTAVLNKQKQVDLDWVTAAEVNNNYFTVERSPNGVDFETVLVTDGAGNSSQILHYSGIDHSPLPGISYYRLKQTDFDGRYAYSSLIYINNSDEGSLNVLIYPNPATDYLVLEFKNFTEETEIRLKLIDQAGHTILSEMYDPGKNQLDISSLASGSYQLILTGNYDYFYSTIIIKQ